MLLARDVADTAFRVALHAHLFEVMDAIDHLRQGFDRKAEEFKGILKMGRTQLQDAEVELSSCLAQRQISLRALSRMKVGDILPIELPSVFEPNSVITLRGRAQSAATREFIECLGEATRAGMQKDPTET